MKAIVYFFYYIGKNTASKGLRGGGQLLEYKKHFKLLIPLKLKGQIIFDAPLSKGEWDDGRATATWNT